MSETATDHYIHLYDPTQGFNGSDLPRRQRSKLNRVKTGNGKCTEFLYKWGTEESLQCEYPNPSNPCDLEGS